MHISEKNILSTLAVQENQTIAISHASTTAPTIRTLIIKEVILKLQVLQLQCWLNIDFIWS